MKGHTEQRTHSFKCHPTETYRIYIVYPDILGTSSYSSSIPCRIIIQAMKLFMILAATLAVSVHAVNKKSLKKNEQAMFFDGKQLLALQQFPAKFDR